MVVGSNVLLPEDCLKAASSNRTPFALKLHRYCEIFTLCFRRADDQKRAKLTVRFVIVAEVERNAGIAAHFLLDRGVKLGDELEKRSEILLGLFDQIFP